MFMFNVFKDNSHKLYSSSLERDNVFHVCSMNINKFYMHL